MKNRKQNSIWASFRCFMALRSKAPSHNFGEFNRGLGRPELRNLSKEFGLRSLHTHSVSWPNTRRSARKQCTINFLPQISRSLQRLWVQRVDLLSLLRLLNWEEFYGKPPRPEENPGKEYTLWESSVSRNNTWLSVDLGNLSEMWPWRLEGTEAFLGVSWKNNNM